MRNFTMNIKDINGEEKEIHLRLTSQHCVEIEKNKQVRLLDYVQDYSITTIVTLLRYMRIGGGESYFTENMAYTFYDELIDNGYTMLDILNKVVYETLVVSGVISAEDLANIRKQLENKDESEEKPKNAKK